MPADDRLIDPDCTAGKHGSCVGDPCECGCHHAEFVDRVMADFGSEFIKALGAEEADRA